MKAVILAGGFGTRLSEETINKPKPMIEIGGKPIIWHIMKIYSYYGVDEFIICCGYKGEIIKEYFSNYFIYNSDVTFDYNNNTAVFHDKKAEKWKVTLVDTGLETMTGGRIKKIHDFVKNEKYFCLTYGDGVADINISELINFHISQNKLATLTATQPLGRFGALDINNNDVINFKEKPKGDGVYINGGFFVLSPKVIKYIKDDYTSWEKEPLEWLARDSQLCAFKHDGFWQPMDTLRDKQYLEKLINTNSSPWIKW